MNLPRQPFAQAFGCDLRSLALFRIALGVMLLADLAWRVPLVAALFSENGAWPLEAAIAESGETPSLAWLLKLIPAATASTWVLFSAAAIAAVALIAGWHTRIATILAWVLTILIQQRNTLVLNGGDIILHLLLFWAMFLPLGACFSMDARGRAPVRGTITGAATVALLAQVALIYFFNALYKTSPAWRVTHEATVMALSLETYSTGIGRWLLGYPAVLRAATAGVWHWELLGPFLPFIPWKNHVFRTVAALGFIGFHLSLLLTLRIGLFPLIGVIAWIPFLPAALWERIAPLRNPADAIAPRRPAPGLQIAVATILAYVIVWNVWGLFKRPPLAFRRVGHLLHLAQKWSLFAPAPNLTEGRVIPVIETTHDTGYDPFTGAPTNWKRPPDLGTLIPSAQWRKYLAAARDTTRPARARLLAEYLRREWQGAHPDHTIVRVRIHYVFERVANRTPPPTNWLIFEDPPGPIGEMAGVGSRARDIPPVDQSDN